MKKIELENGKTVTIEKLPLGKYAELLKAIKELPKHISGFDQMDKDKIIEQLPAILSQSVPDLIAILTIAANMEAEEVEALALDEATEIVVAIIEVNKYQMVYANLKKVLAPPTPTE